MVLSPFLLLAYQAADMLMMGKLQNNIVDLVLRYHQERVRSLSFTWARRFHELNLVHMSFYDLVLKSSVRGFVATPLDDNGCGRYIDELAKYPSASMERCLDTNQRVQPQTMDASQQNATVSVPYSPGTDW